MRCVHRLLAFLLRNFKAPESINTCQGWKIRAFVKTSHTQRQFLYSNSRLTLSPYIHTEDNESRHKVAAVISSTVSAAPICRTSKSSASRWSTVLQSTKCGDMFLPWIRIQLGRRSFHVTVPVVWNVLPLDLSRDYNCDSTTIRLRYDDTTTHSTTTEVIEITICVRFDCDTTTTRLRRKIDMLIFCSRWYVVVVLVVLVNLLLVNYLYQVMISIIILYLRGKEVSCYILRVILIHRKLTLLQSIRNRSLWI